MVGVLGTEGDLADLERLAQQRLGFLMVPVVREQNAQGMEVGGEVGMPGSNFPADIDRLAVGGFRRSEVSLCLAESGQTLKAGGATRMTFAQSV